MRPPNERLPFGGPQVRNHHALIAVPPADYSIEGTVPIKELCPLKGLREFDVDGELPLQLLASIA